MGPYDRPVDLAGFEPATSSVRLRRAPAAPQAPIGVPDQGVEIVLERIWGVKKRLLGALYNRI